MATKTATKNQNATPIFAVVGAADLAVERAREARVRVEQVRSDLAPTAVQARASKVVEDVKALPTKALNDGVATVDQATKRYEDLAARGEKLVKRIQNQKATKDLVAQAEATLALGKGAVTTARKSVGDVRSSALATFTTGRKEAVKVAETLATTVENIADTVEADTQAATTEVKAAAKRTRTAAKRTSTTATKAAKKTTTSAKATTTSARKTAAGTTKATKKAAEKVGD